MKASEFIKLLESDDIDYKAIYNESKRDSSLDTESKELDRQITDNIDVQVKWNVIKLSVMEKISEIDKNLSNKKRDILEYWKGLKEDKPKKYLEKAEITSMVNNDKEVLEYTRELNKYKNILSYIETFMKTLNNKHFAIGHYIEWKKATNGFV